MKKLILILSIIVLIYACGKDSEAATPPSNPTDNPLTEIKNLIDLDLLKSFFVESTNLSSLDVSSITSLDYLDANDTPLLDCISVSQSQLDNLVSSWLFDDGTKFSLDCN